MAALNIVNSDAQFTVTTEVLKNKSTEVKSMITKLQQEFEEMRNQVSTTAHYWIGAAGDEYRRKFQEYEPECEEIISRLTEEVNDLEKIAGVYEDTENEIAETSGGLPDDVIV